MSFERTDVIDRDVVIWSLGTYQDRADVEAIPLHGQLKAVERGGEVFLDDELLYGALNFSTVLSLPVLLRQLAPMLAAAVDGDPATEVPS